MVKRTWKSAAAKRILHSAGNPESMSRAIQIIVNRLLENISCPPTDLNSLGKKLDVESIIFENMTANGELRRGSHKKYIVACSKTLSPGRQNFTIAHEFAHIIVSGTSRSILTWGEELEVLCDMIAAEILMPTDISIRSIENGLTSEQFQELFNVSQQAASIRYEKVSRLAKKKNT